MKSRWMLRLALGCALLLLILALLIALAGSAWVLGRLAGQPALQGSIWQGLRAERLQGEFQGKPWVLEGLELAPLRWRNGRLETALRLRRAQFALPEGQGGPPPTAEQLLAQLRLPLQLRIAPLQIERLQIDAHTVEALRLQALQVGGRDEPLRLQALQLREPRSGLQLQADAQLRGDGALLLQLQAQRETLRLSAEGQGRLDALQLQLQLHDAQTEQLQAELRLAPLAAEPLQILQALQARFQALNPQALHPQAPAGAWAGSLKLEPAGSGQLRLQAEARNAQASRLDAGGWPLRHLALRLQLDPQRWQALDLQQLELELGSAERLAGRLSLQPQQGLPQPGAPLDSRLRLQAVQLQGLDRRWPTGQLDGELGLRQSRLDPEAPLDWQLRLRSQLPKPIGELLSEGQGSLQGRKLQLASLKLRQGQAQAQLSGQAELLANGRGWRTEGQLQLDGLELPLPPWPQPSLLHAQAGWQLGEDAAGRQTGQLQLELLDGNRLAGVPLQGRVDWRGELAAQAWTLALQGSDGLQLAASGRQDKPLRLRDGAGKAEDWLPRAADWKLPRLAALKPLWQPWLAALEGRLDGRWRWQPGAWPTLQLAASQLKLQAAKDKATTLQLAGLQAELDQEQGEIHLQGLVQGSWQLERLQARGGRQQAWQLDGVALHTLASGSTRRWVARGGSQQPEIREASWSWPALHLELGREGQTALLALREGRLSLDPDGPALRLEGAQLLAGGELLQLQQASWQADGPWALALQGRPKLAAWLRQADPANAWDGEAQVALQLSAEGGAEGSPRLQLGVDSLQGDLRLNGRALNLQRLAINLRQTENGSAALSLQAGSALFGSLESQLTQTEAGALAGQLRAELPQLASLRPWLPGGLQLEGSARLDAQIGGSRDDPRLRGEFGLQLGRLLHPGSGFAAQRGELRAEFSENRLLLQRIHLQGQTLPGVDDDGGSLNGSGELRWGGEAPEAELQLKAERFRALSRFDRRLVASGEAQLALLPRRIKLSGKLVADEGVYEFGSPDAPVLDDDVVVERPDLEKTPPTSRWQREIDLQLDLGQRLRVQGRGFASRLTGQLRLQQQGDQALRATGQIETQGGRYKAYGQTLDIESGVVRFTGALDNPRLELLAIKPDIEHRVGVSVTGSAQSPRIRLYAEPDLSDNDKLAWLLLGRDPSEISGKDTAILQRAALALLSGESSSPASELMDRLGLTEFSLSQGEDAATVLRLGAQLSRRWSVGYERSLNAATGSWQLVYRLGQRFRLRAQSGLDSAVDLLWLWRFD